MLKVLIVEDRPAVATALQVLFEIRGVPGTPWDDEKLLGVGFPLCREIVEAHGGRLRIERRQGGGTVVVCWVPGR